MFIDRIIQKEIGDKIKLSKQSKKAIIIYGARQVGKTTIAKKIKEQYKGNAEYYDCDYLEVREKFAYKNASKLGNILKNKDLIIIDEAQRIENIGLTLKIIIDHHPAIQVIATGSSSFDLSNSIKEPLTGRKIEYYLHPLSVEEIYSDDIIKQSADLNFSLRFGNYPELKGMNETDAREKIEEITNSYLFKDIFLFQDLKKPELLSKLLRLLAFQIGNEVSYHELATKLQVRSGLIERYIYLLEEAFIIFRLGAFKRNLRNEINKSRKIYFWDLGIRNAIIQNFNSFEFRNDLRHLWENYCIAERLKFLFNHRNYANTYFWRTYTQKEIDYIEERDGKLFAFEFKYGNKNTKPPKEFLDTYKNSTFQVIDRDNYLDFIL